MVDLWAGDHNKRIRGTKFEKSGFVDAAAYTSLVREFSSKVDGTNFFGRIVYLNGMESGFSFAGRIGSESAALFTSFSKVRRRGLSEALLLDFVEQLSKKGVKRLNLGGSETPGLFRYKSKFGAEYLLEKFDLKFDT